MCNDTEVERLAGSVKRERDVRYGRPAAGSAPATEHAWTGFEHLRTHIELSEREAWARSWFEEWQVVYEVGHNPVVAWRAYLLSVCFGVSAPEWVVGYLSLAAENLIDLLNEATKPKAGEIAPVLAAVFGFAPGGVEHYNRHKWPAGDGFREKLGAFNPLATDPARGYHLAHCVGLLMQMFPGHTKTKAVTVIAMVEGVSVSTVWRALKAYPEAERRGRLWPRAVDR